MTKPPEAYAELCVTTNFTFLTGASHPEEMVTRAAELGLSAIAITDRNSLAGVVRAYAALKELQRETDGALQVRSRQQTDPSSRQSMDDPTPLPRPRPPPAPASGRVPAGVARQPPALDRPAPRPRRLPAADPASDAGQAAGREGRLPSAPARPDRRWRGADPDRPAARPVAQGGGPSHPPRAALSRPCPSGRRAALRRLRPGVVAGLRAAGAPLFDADGGGG